MDLDPLHICYICIAWLLVGFLAVESGPVPKALTGPWGPIPHTGLPFPTLTQGQNLLSSNSL